MKPKSTTFEPQQIQTLDGPPLDFSFKNLRLLEHISQCVTTSVQHPVEIDQKTTKLVSDTLQSSVQEQKEVYEPKLEIIRTIETNQHQFMEQKNQKIIGSQEKQDKKIKKKIIPQTTSLFLRYNKLISLEGLDKVVNNVFPNILNLMWIDLSHNRFTELPSQINFPSLKTLYLHANYIFSFKEIEKLKNIPTLRTLTVYGNPLEQYEEFRIVICAILPELRKLDSTLLTRREKERTQVLMKSLKKFPIIKNPRKPPPESDAEEDD